MHGIVTTSYWYANKQHWVIYDVVLLTKFNKKDVTNPQLDDNINNTHNNSPLDSPIQTLATPETLSTTPKSPTVPPQTRIAWWRNIYFLFGIQLAATVLLLIRTWATPFPSHAPLYLELSKRLALLALALGTVLGAAIQPSTPRTKRDAWHRFVIKYVEMPYDVIEMLVN